MPAASAETGSAIRAGHGSQYGFGSARQSVPFDVDGDDTGAEGLGDVSASRTSGRTSPDDAPSRRRASARNTSSRARNAGVPFRRLAATARSAWAAAAAGVAGAERGLGEHLVDRTDHVGTGVREVPGVGPSLGEDVASRLAVAGDLGRLGELGHREGPRHGRETG